jgi:hypothetical protein
MALTTISRFKTAFTDIEHWLKQILLPTKNQRFTDMVKQAAKQDLGVRRMQSTLLDLAVIRNVLTHNPNGAHPRVDLTEHAAAEIEKVRGILLSPPRLLPAFAKEVVTCNAEEPLSLVLVKMATNSVKKLPIYRGPNLVGLLVSRTLARWLARCSTTGIPQFSQVNVEHLLQYQEGDGLYKLLPSSATYFDAVAAFQETTHKLGHHLDAILITANGNDAEPLLGIVTVAQMPKLVQAIAIEV